LDLMDDPGSELDPKFLDSPRQRIEFRSPINANDGTSWTFTWKSYYPSSIKTTTTFFHVMQIFSVGDSKPAYTLDLVKDAAAIKDFFNKTVLQSVPITEFFDRPLLNIVNVTFGPQGRFEFVLLDTINEAELMHVKTTGCAGTGGSYLKFGAYRKTWEGMGAVRAWCGDYTCTQHC